MNVACMANNNKNLAKTLIVLSACAALGFAATHLKHGLLHEDEAEYPVTHPWRQTLNIDKAYVAQINAIQHIELRSYERGYLQNIYVDEGQRVTKGQDMFQVMPLMMEAEFAKAKAEYELAKIEYDNTQNLQKRKVVSDNELALAKARLDKAAAEMKLADTHLKFTTVKAPFDGIMDRFRVRLGSLIEEGELLTTLSDNSQMWVYFNTSEADYLEYMSRKKSDEKQPVSLVLANGKRFDQTGYIDTIEADFNNETGNVAFRASFPNPNGLLRHGETGNVLLTEEFKDALVIPQKATFEILDKKFVYVIDKDEKVESRQITIAQEVPHLFLIKSGLEEGDTVLLEGLGKIKLGEHIKTHMEEREEVVKNLHLSVD